MGLTPSDRLEELFGTETLATLREVALMHRDLGPVVPRFHRAGHGEDVAVLVHGFCASAGVFRPMKARLERELGCHVATFSHAPGASVRRIAKQLAAVVERIPLGARIHVIGHSLGGLIARWYVQEMEGWRRVTQTISLATPFGGVEVAKRIPVLVGNELKAGSAVLSRLLRSAHVGSIPHTSIVAGADKLVIGAHAATFTHGDVHVLPGRGHNTLLFDEDAVRIVAGRIRHRRDAQPLDAAAQ